MLADPGGDQGALFITASRAGVQRTAVGCAGGLRVLTPLSAPTGAPVTPRLKLKYPLWLKAARLLESGAEINLPLHHGDRLGRADRRGLHAEICCDRRWK